MTTLVLDPYVEKDLLKKRQQTGADRYDEVWEGVYIMTPMPNNEHQALVLDFGYILYEVVNMSKLGQAFPGANISDREEDWKQNYRVPDVAVFLNGGKARDCDTHWVGGPDFLLEITSEYDQTRDKLPFYASIGTREVLILDRDPWQLELYRLENGQLNLMGRSSLDEPATLSSTVLPLTFRLTTGEARPRIEVQRHDGQKQWTI